MNNPKQLEKAIENANQQIKATSELLGTFRKSVRKAMGFGPGLRDRMSARGGFGIRKSQEDESDNVATGFLEGKSQETYTETEELPSQDQAQPQLTPRVQERFSRMPIRTEIADPIRMISNAMSANAFSRTCANSKIIAVPTNLPRPSVGPNRKLCLEQNLVKLLKKRILIGDVA